jgi:hypothetical protein
MLYLVFIEILNIIYIYYLLFNFPFFLYFEYEKLKFKKNIMSLSNKSILKFIIKYLESNFNESSIKNF